MQLSRRIYQVYFGGKIIILRLTSAEENACRKHVLVRKINKFKQSLELCLVSCIISLLLKWCLKTREKKINFIMEFNFVCNVIFLILYKIYY